MSFFPALTAHSILTTEKLLVFIYYLPSIVRISKQAKFLFSYLAMAKVPKRDLGPFLRVVRNALLGVSIWEKRKWRNCFAIVQITVNWFWAEALNYIICDCVCDISKISLILCVLFRQQNKCNLGISGFLVLIVFLWFQRDHNFAIRFDQEISSHDQPPPNVPEGPAHKYVLYIVHSIGICLDRLLFHSTDFDFNCDCEMKEPNAEFLRVEIAIIYNFGSHTNMQAIVAYGQLKYGWLYEALKSEMYKKFQ